MLRSLGVAGDTDSDATLVEDLEQLYSVELPHEDVETVGGLLAQALGRVPIPGATAELNGLVLVAESAKGRRNRIGTVLVRRQSDDHDEGQRELETWLDSFDREMDDIDWTASAGGAGLPDFLREPDLR